MAELDNATGWPDWWDEGAYGYTAHLTRRDWAWEFLRRNPTFQRDLRRALERVDYTEIRQSLDVIASPVDLLSWGVLFR